MNSRSTRDEEPIDPKVAAFIDNNPQLADDWARLDPSVAAAVTERKLTEQNKPQLLIEESDLEDEIEGVEEFEEPLTEDVVLIRDLIESAFAGDRESFSAIFEEIMKIKIARTLEV